MRGTFQIFVGLLFALPFVACSGQDLAPGDNFCMDYDNDGVIGAYVVEEGDDLSGLPIVSCSLAESFDCNDDNDQSYPGAIEVYNNGVDENCDGDDSVDLSLVDDDDDETDDTDDDETAEGSCDDGSDPKTYYLDADGDGFGRSTSSVETCDDAPTTYVDNSTDCDDNNGAIYPGAEESLGDDIDQDCDGGIDSMDCSDQPVVTYYADLDSDGYYDLDNYVVTCMRPGSNYYKADEADSEGSCSDSNKYANPGMRGRDYGYLIYQEDPNATAMERFRSRPAYAATGYGNVERPALPWQGSTVTQAVVSTLEYNFNEIDGMPAPASGLGVWSAGIVDVDNDCDGEIDEDGYKLPGQYDNKGLYFNHCDIDGDGINEGAATFYPDQDQDTYGDETNPGSYTCRLDPPTDHNGNKFVENNEDCHDHYTEFQPYGDDPSNYKGRLYMYKGHDNDCDGRTDEDMAIETDEWDLTIAWNGQRFTDKGNDNTQHEKVGSYFGSNFNYSTDHNTFKVDGDVNYHHGGGANDKYSYRVSYTPIKMNKTYGQFWHGKVKITISGSGETISSPDTSLGLSGSCDDYNNCTGNGTIDLTTEDAEGNKLYLYDYYGKRASIFMRGFQFTHDKTRKFMDQHGEIYLDDGVDIGTDGKLSFKVKTNVNGSSPSDVTITIPFTVLVYDPDYVMVKTFDRTTNGWSRGDNHDKYIKQIESLDFSDMFEFEMPDEWNCDSEDDCVSKYRTAGSLLRSWGFDHDDNFEVHKLKGMSFVKRWNTTGTNTAEVTIKSKGVAYRRDNHRVAPQEMMSRLLICSNSKVCEVRFSKVSGSKEQFDPVLSWPDHF